LNITKWNIVTVRLHLTMRHWLLTKTLVLPSVQRTVYRCTKQVHSYYIHMHSKHTHTHTHTHARTHTYTRKCLSTHKTVLHINTSTVSILSVRLQWHSKASPNTSFEWPYWWFYTWPKPIYIVLGCVLS